MKSVRSKSTSVLLLLLAVGSPKARGQVLLEDLNGDGIVKVVAHGDSITRGTGDNNSDARGNPEFGGYPARLQLALNVPVFNSGKGGESADEGADRLPGVLGAEQPDFVIVMEGANDITAQNIGGVPDDIDSMIDSVFATGALPLVGTVTPLCCSRDFLDDLSSELSSDLRVLAQERGVPLIDFREAFAPGDDFDSGSGLIWTSDGLHPTPAGYDLMANVAAAAFKPRPLCQGQTVTIYGTSGDDVIVGTPAADVIHAGKGNDQIFGLEGDDVICASAGNDFVEAGDGNDLVSGGKGDDLIKARKGVDACKGGAGVDTFTSCEVTEDK